MRTMYQVRVLKLITIILICTSCQDINNQKFNIENNSDNYVELAKLFEQKYLPKYNNFNEKRKYANINFEKIAKKNGFNKEKIGLLKEEVYGIARKYGFNSKKIKLNKYFFINPLSKKPYEKEFYEMLFAYMKYKKEIMIESIKKREIKMNNTTDHKDSLIKLK